MVKNWLDSAKASASITVFTGMALAMLAQPASAGFEWTPPPMASAPPVAPAPAQAVDAEVLDSPVPMPGELPEVQAPAPSMQMEAVPVMRPAAPPAPVESANVAPPVMSAPAPSMDFASSVGFGSDIPLVLAMRQIVPADYSYSFDEGVNPGARVSWSGGKPWDETLADAVRPQGLEVVISGNTVWLRQGWDDSEKIRASVAAMHSTVKAEPDPMPEPVPVPVMVSPAPAEMQDPVPMPLAAPVYTAPAAPEPIHQSYPRRQRPDMPEMIYQQQAMPIAPAPMMPTVPSAAVYENDAYVANYTDGPVPLMKALPPPPEPAAPIKSTAQAPAMVSPHAAAQPLAMNQTRGPVMDPLDIHFWQAEQGASLKEALGRWAGTANVAMLWNSPYDYALPAPVRMHGTFADAVTNVLMTYGMADPRPLGRLHPNLPAGPSVLVIDNYTEATN